MYNFNGEPGSRSGFLRGPPAAWAEQLAALTFEAGISSFILSVESDHQVRKFAEEVAPAVRELVETERGREAVSAPAPAGHSTGAAPLLTDTMLSHLSYEERGLVEPLARLGFY